jgi:hypothetical protein
MAGRPIAEMVERINIFYVSFFVVMYNRIRSLIC